MYRPSLNDRMDGVPPMEEVKARLRADVKMVDSNGLYGFLHQFSAEPAPVARAIRENVLLCVEGLDGSPMFPVFQFDPDGNLNLIVKEVNEVLMAGVDPWGALDWWASANPWLPGGPAPMSLVRTQAQDVLPEVVRALLG